MSWLVIVGATLAAVSVVLLLPVLVLLLQVVSAAFGRGRAGMTPDAPRPRLAVLMPAHNEAAGIAAALATVRPQLHPGDRILVVGDNCTDDTAAVAAAHGAEVIVRRDAQRRGKGYALDFGVRHLAADPPGVVIVVDADCAVAAGALDALARRSHASGRPVQALYRMHAPAGAALSTRVAQFAWIVKNEVRPLGFARLGLPCQLMGTGMAFPWELIATAPLASGHLVEDLQLGLDLAASGAPPLFCPQALVSSSFPAHAEGVAQQRTRWEHGHLSVLLGVGPRLLWRSLVRGRPLLAAMALDLCVPPLASLVMALFAWLIAAGVFVAIGGDALALGITAVALTLLQCSAALAWWRFARQAVSLRDLLGIPAYVLRKLPVYLRWFTGRQTEWVRTKRDDKPN